MTEAAGERPRWRRVTRSAWFHLVVAFAVVGLLLTFVAKPYQVPTESMNPTLQPSDRVLVSRLAFVGSEPASGDVIVFDVDGAWGPPPVSEDAWWKVAAKWVGEVTGFGPSGAHTLVKRVIAGPGQTVECCTDSGEITVDGIPLEESYVQSDFPFEVGEIDCSSEPVSLRCFAPVVVPERSFLVLGDNRSNSSDSAAQCRGSLAAESCWRWAMRDEIIGKVSMVIWPVARWGAP